MMITVKNIENLLMEMDVLEAVAQTCSAKNMLLEISQNSQEDPCARVSVLIKLQTWGLQLY